MKDLFSIQIANNIEAIAARLTRQDATVDCSAGEVFNEGYFVSIEGHGQVLPVLRASNLNEVRGWVNREFAGAWNNNLLFGRWTDGDNVYFDVSVQVDDLNTALTVARANNQLAVWDAEKGEEIRVN